MCERTDDGVFVCAWWHHREPRILTDVRFFAVSAVDDPLPGCEFMDDESFLASLDEPQPITHREGCPATQPGRWAACLCGASCEPMSSSDESATVVPPDAPLDAERYAQFLEARGYVNDAALVRRKAERERTEQFIHSVATREFPTSLAPPTESVQPPAVRTDDGGRSALPNYTTERQAELLQRLLRRPNHEVYLDCFDLLVLNFDVTLSDDEAALVRMIRS
jgi:hypothetical protein